MTMTTFRDIAKMFLKRIPTAALNHQKQGSGEQSSAGEAFFNTLMIVERPRNHSYFDKSTKLGTTVVY